jgi:lipopolysaccharide heptosyltransferase III
VAINPDAAARSAELATIAKAGVRHGFTMSERGEVIALGEAAERWLVAGGSDPAKRANKKTYQQVLHEMCGLGPEGQYIVLGLTDEESEKRAELASSVGVDLDRPVVGINTGAGKRWKLKRWTTDGFVEVIGALIDSTDAGIVLLGGEAEREQNCLVRAHFPERVANPGTGDLRSFMRVVDLCDVVLTGDTLALHVAVGLKKRVVAIFGPTSAEEIDLYGRGTKVVSDIDCRCCYKSDCSREPNCMDVIRPETVYEAVARELASVAGGHLESYSMVGEPGR